MIWWPSLVTDDVVVAVIVAKAWIGSPAGTPLTSGVRKVKDTGA